MSNAPSGAESIVSGQTPQIPESGIVGHKGIPKEAYTADTKLNTMSDLKREAPDVHKAMMEGIAHSIVRKMQAHSRRMKRLIREGQRQR